MFATLGYLVMLVHTLVRVPPALGYLVVLMHATVRMVKSEPSRTPDAHKMRRYGINFTSASEINSSTLPPVCTSCPPIVWATMAVVPRVSALATDSRIAASITG